MGFINKNSVEKIEKQGNGNPIRGIKSCKTFRKALQTLIGQYYKRGNTELEFHTRGILELYNKYHPEKKAQVEVESWKGKSSFELIQELDKLIIIKYQKPNKDEIAQEIKTEVTREELEALIRTLGRYQQEEEIETKHIAVTFSYFLGLGHTTWKEFFSDRKWHNKLTLMLGALQELGLIEYKGGKTKLLNNNISIQRILPLQN